MENLIRIRYERNSVSMGDDYCENVYFVNPDITLGEAIELSAKELARGASKNGFGFLWSLSVPVAPKSRNGEPRRVVTVYVQESGKSNAYPQDWPKSGYLFYYPIDLDLRQPFCKLGISSKNPKYAASLYLHTEIPMTEPVRYRFFENLAFSGYVINVNLRDLYEESRPRVFSKIRRMMNFRTTKLQQIFDESTDQYQSNFGNRRT